MAVIMAICWAHHWYTEYFQHMYRVISTVGPIFQLETETEISRMVKHLIEFLSQLCLGLNPTSTDHLLLSALGKSLPYS